jgi:hypothetical protein
MLHASGFGKGEFSTHEPPAGEEVIVYLVGAESMTLAGAVNETFALPLDAVATTLLGASGFANGFTEEDVGEAEVVPVALVAVVVNV